MMASWRVNILGKAPIGTYAKMGNKLYVKEEGNTPSKGEWYRPWRCIKIDDFWVKNGGYASSIELGFSGGKILKLGELLGDEK